MAKIMIVDDSYSEIQGMESVLVAAGYEVTSLTDPTTVEAKLAENRPDLLLLDVVMPKRNGYEVLRSIRKNEETKALPVIVVSSKDQDSDREWGKRQGANDYVVKPFTPEELLGAVQKLAR